MVHDDDHVVLVDDAGLPIGSADRGRVHHRSTPLHLAFSCYLVDPEGRLLVTRRALSKVAWPGVWTNSVCGHPRALREPAGDPKGRLTVEDYPAAIARRARHELGCDVADVTELLPDFRYRAVDPSLTVEHEICPVFRARTSGVLDLNPAEVMDHAWVSPADLAVACAATPWAFSPWLVLQWAELTRIDAFGINAERRVPS